MPSFVNTQILCLCLCLLYSLQLAAEESPQQVCESAANLAKEGDLKGALEEARWCVTLLEQQQQARVLEHFVGHIMGFRGNALEQQNAMGFLVISRQYVRDNQYINVSLNAGSSGAANQVFSAIASLGLQTGGEKIRIQRRTATLLSDNGKNSVSVTLKSGGMLTFESNDLDAAALIEFAKAFPVAEIDDARG